MFQIGIDGLILSQAAEVLNPVGLNESVLGSCAKSYKRCLEDLAFALVYADKLLKYSHPRSPINPNEYKAGYLLDEIESQDEHILDMWPVDKDLHSNQLVDDPTHKPFIVDDLSLLQSSVLFPRSEGLFFIEWLARESSIYFGTDNSVFKEKANPSDYKYGVQEPYVTNRQIQDSVDQRVVKILDAAVERGPKGSNDKYSEGARKEFITRNMLTLVTIMRAYELSANRNRLCRIPHVTRVRIRLSDLKRRIGNQLELRNMVVQHALFLALKGIDSRDSLIRYLVDLRGHPIIQKIRQVLSEIDLLLLAPDETKDRDAVALRREIIGLVGLPTSQGDHFTVDRNFALRSIGAVDLEAYERHIYRVFPELSPRKPDAIGSRPAAPDGNRHIGVQQGNHEVKASVVKWGEIEQLVREVDAAKSSDEKGKSLERLCSELFATVPGLIVRGHRIHTATEEIDIEVENGRMNPWLTKEAVLILVECKNWATNCGKDELVLFMAKVENRKKRCSLGFLISWKGFADTVRREMLRSSHGRALIVLMTEHEIRASVKDRDFEKTLREGFFRVVNL